MKIMNTSFELIACTLVLTSALAWGQAPPPSALPTTPSRLPSSLGSLPPPPPSAAPAPGQEEPTKFDLDFPGGTPKELVAAIQKAMRRPLNAIVPEEFNDVRLPALKMDHVNVQQLFEALAAAGRKSEAVTSGNNFGGGYSSYQVVNTGYGFRQGSQGRITDDTIWYFYVDKPALPPAIPQNKKFCRFYSLASYLDQNMTVDDITTAIETGWKMLGEKPTPTISYHKDTKLLIGVGEPDKLEIIDSVLRALSERPRPQPAQFLPAHPAAPKPTPGSVKPKPEKADE